MAGLAAVADFGEGGPIGFSNTRYQQNESDTLAPLLL